MRPEAALTGDADGRLVFDELLGDRLRKHGLVHDACVLMHGHRDEVRHEGNASRKHAGRTSARQFASIDQNPKPITSPAKNTTSLATKSRPASGAIS